MSGEGFRIEPKPCSKCGNHEVSWPTGSVYESRMVVCVCCLMKKLDAAEEELRAVKDDPRRTSDALYKLRVATDETERLKSRLAVVSKREAELHYAIRKEANILDHKLTEEEAHRAALDRVAGMHAFAEAMYAAGAKR